MAENNHGLFLRFHPGAFIRDEMEALEIDTVALAKALGLSQADTDALLDGRLVVTEALAARLAAVLGPPPHIWLGLQHRYDAWRAEQNEATASAA